MATAAAVRTFPFRVYSFPTDVKLRPLAFDQSVIKLATPAEIAEVETGLNIRFVRTFDPTAARFVNRFDMLYGFGNLYPRGDVGQVKTFDYVDDIDPATIQAFIS